MADTSSSKKKVMKTVKQEEKIEVEVSAPVSEKNDAEKEEVQEVQVENAVLKQYDPNMYVPVRNGFSGHLVYKSRRTGEVFEWDGLGTEQMLTIQDLRDARNTSKDFFSENWFLIDDPNILRWLGVEQYYKFAVPFDSLDEIFGKSVSEIERIISGMSDSQKEALATKARDGYNNGSIDSIAVIRALEKGLSISLIG